MNRLKELRKEKKLTLNQLSEKVGIPRATLSRYENGKSEPKQEIWEHIADFFEVSVAYLMGISDSATDLPEFLRSIFEHSSDTMKEIVMNNDTEISEAVAFSLLTLNVNFDKAVDDYKKGNPEVVRDLRYVYWVISEMFQGKYADKTFFDSLERSEFFNTIENHVSNLSTEERKEKYDLDKKKLIQILDKYAFLNNK